jgi:YidC/Oxa1 family membrane protein insertase
MTTLYRANGVSPAGGCLPVLLQAPIFLILYGTIRGLIHRAPSHGRLVPKPLYIDPSSALYHAVTSTGGQLKSFGVNLAYSVRSGGLDWTARLPFIALILAAILLQYVQMRQLAGRNPQPETTSPRSQQLQRAFPLLSGVIYLSIPAAMTIYFVVSSIVRIGQQELLYRRDPRLREAIERLRGDRGTAEPEH